MRGKGCDESCARLCCGVREWVDGWSVIIASLNRNCSINCHIRTIFGTIAVNL